jgi:hypothetical protein
VIGRQQAALIELAPYRQPRKPTSAEIMNTLDELIRVELERREVSQFGTHVGDDSPAGVVDLAPEKTGVNQQGERHPTLSGAPALVRSVRLAKQSYGMEKTQQNAIA